MITDIKLQISSKPSETRSVHGLRPECLSFGAVLAQFFAVIAPTTIPASNIGLIVALAGNGACPRIHSNSCPW